MTSAVRTGNVHPHRMFIAQSPQAPKLRARLDFYIRLPHAGAKRCGRPAGVLARIGRRSDRDSVRRGRADTARENLSARYYVQNQNFRHKR